MKKIFKFILVVFIWLLILGVCVVGALLLGSTESLGLQVFAGLFAVWYGLKLLAYLFRRFQAKRRVEKLINIDTSVEESKTKLSFFEYLFSKDIDKHIKGVIKRLNSNAPIGEETQDASFLMHLKMKNSHSNWLHTKSVNKPKIQDPIFSEYKNINWIAYNHLVVLDVDSYLVENADPSPNHEWIQLLSGLASSTKMNALDGLLITVHVADLVDPDTRNRLADTLRNKYEQIKEYCGVEVPISITLLGLEELAGVDDWLAQLSKDLKSRSLGVINRQHFSAKDLVRNCFDQINDLFKQGSLSYLVNKGFDKDVANLTHKTNDVQLCVEAFCSRLSASNSFQGGARTSGFFIVMADESGVSFADELLEQSALCWSPAIATNRNTAHDLVQSKRTATYVTAAAVLVIALVMLHNSNTDSMQRILEIYQIKESKSVERDKLVANYQNRYQLIDGLSEISIGHWLPMSKDDFKIPLLKSRLAADIQDVLILPIDTMFASQITDLDKGDMDTKVDYINILIRRINVLNAATNGASLDDLAGMPQPFDSAYIDSMSSTVIEGLNDLYLKSLFMQKSVNDAQAWQEQMVKDRLTMSSLILSSNGDMDWLVDWVSNNTAAKEITIKDYWKGSLNSTTPLTIRGAYTVAGKAVIDDFVEQIVAALGEDHPFLSKYLSVFEQQYQDNYLASWNAFLNGFNDGKDTLNSRSEWLNVLNDLTTGRNIFFKLLNDADFQLSPFKAMENQPDWMVFVFYYQDILALGSDNKQGNPKKNKVFTKLGLKVIGALGPVGKALSGSAKSTLKTKKKLDKAEGSGPGASERELNMQAAAINLDEYKTLISTIVFNIEQKDDSYKSIKALYEFENNSIEEGTSLANAKINIRDLQSLIGKSRLSNQSFWNVYTGAVLLMEDFMMAETACVLEDKWNTDFLYELDGVPDYKLEAFAYGESGVLWDFFGTRLQPFFKNKRGSGYGFKQVAGKKIALKSDLLQYLIRARDLSQRAKFESFDLLVTAKPTDTNGNALMYVSQTDVSLMCAAGTQTLSNNNYIVKKAFKWDESCNAVSIKLHVGNKVLEKRFDGDNGVLDFLTAFKTGRARFELDVFPDFFFQLVGYKIEHFDVNLDIDGRVDLASALSVKPPRPPETIAQCWI